MRKIKEKRNELVTEIINQYHYSRWVQERHKRIDEIPEPIQKIYFRFGTLAEFPATSQEEEKNQFAELKQIRKKLKKYYRKGDKSL